MPRIQQMPLSPGMLLSPSDFAVLLRLEAQLEAAMMILKSP